MMEEMYEEIDTLLYYINGFKRNPELIQGVANIVYIFLTNTYIDI